MFQYFLYIKVLAEYPESQSVASAETYQELVKRLDEGNL